MSGAVKALAWADRPRISPSTDKRTIECRSCEVFVSAFKDGGSLFFRFLTNFDLFFSFHGPLLKTADASERGVITTEGWYAFSPSLITRPTIC